MNEKLNFKDFGEGMADTFTEGDSDILPSSMVDLAVVYGAEKRAIKDVENKIKMRKAALAIMEEKLYALLEDEGIESFSTNGFTYFTRIDTYASVDKAQEGVAFAWIKEAGYEYLIKATVNAQSLTVAVKEYIEENEEIPGETEGIKIRTVNRVGVRKK